MKTPATNQVIYSERLAPSINTYIAVLIVWPTVWLTVYPWNHTSGLWLGALVAGAILAAVFFTAPMIRVTEDELHVGKVSILRAEIAGIEALEGESARRARGPELDPSAFVVFRGTTQRLVRIGISSKVDPTPYWLVSSRRPFELTRALES